MRCSLDIPGEVYFSGDKLVPVHLSEAELARITGRYHSDEDRGCSLASGVRSGK